MNKGENGGCFMGYLGGLSIQVAESGFICRISSLLSPSPRHPASAPQEKQSKVRGLSPRTHDPSVFFSFDWEDSWSST